MKKFDAKYFINKFETIPSDEWAIGKWSDGERSCALGHCGIQGSV